MYIFVFVDFILMRGRLWDVLALHVGSADFVGERTVKVLR